MIAINNGELTDEILDKLIYGDIYSVDELDQMLKNLETSTKLDERNIFLEGVVKHLSKRGFECDASDIPTITDEIKRGYKELLNTDIPKVVRNWLNGTPPSASNRKNLYEFCYAMNMELKETAEFLVKHFLTLPFNFKSVVDAIFYYCLLNEKPYETAAKMLETSHDFDVCESNSANTSEVGRRISEIKSDDEFIGYLSRNCYNEKAQFTRARREITELVGKNMKLAFVERGEHSENKVPAENISQLLEAIYGFNYLRMQRGNDVEASGELPKRFTVSLPNEATLGKILNGEAATYETLRKTLAVMKLFNFYAVIHNDLSAEADEQEIRDRLYDFFDELDGLLAECGFAQLYVRHPFDWTILFCATNADPIEAFREINAKRYVPK